MIIFQTPNFIIRKFQIGDSRDCEKFLSDDDVMKFIGDGGFDFSKTSSEEMVKWFIKSYENKDSLGTWAIEHKKNNSVIGNCHLSKCSEINEIEFGISLSKESWGKGYASEICSSLIEYGTNNLGIKKIVATVHKGNLASKKMLEKLEYCFERDIVLYGIEHELYFRKNEFTCNGKK